MNFRSHSLGCTFREPLRPIAIASLLSIFVFQDRNPATTTHKDVRFRVEGLGPKDACVVVAVAVVAMMVIAIMLLCW